MGLPVKNGGQSKGNNKGQKNANNGSKFIAKPGGKTSAGGPKKALRTGGTRGS